MRRVRAEIFGGERNGAGDGYRIESIPAREYRQAPMRMQIQGEEFGVGLWPDDAQEPTNRVGSPYPEAQGYISNRFEEEMTRKKRLT